MTEEEFPKKQWWQTRIDMATGLFKKNIEHAHLIPDIEFSVETIAVDLIKKLWQDKGPFVHIAGFHFFSQETGWEYQLEFIKNRFEIIRKI